MARNALDASLTLALLLALALPFAAAGAPALPGVSCGGHRAPTCAECPEGHGAPWCNGECSWSLASNDCVHKEDQRGLGFNFSITDNWGLSAEAQGLLDMYVEWHRAGGRKLPASATLLVVTLTAGLGDVLLQQLMPLLWCCLLAEGENGEPFRYRIQVKDQVPPADHQALYVDQSPKSFWKAGLSPRIQLFYNESSAVPSAQRLFVFEDAEEEAPPEHLRQCMRGSPTSPVRQPPSSLSEAAAMIDLIVRPSAAVRAAIWEASAAPHNELLGVHLRTFMLDNLKKAPRERWEAFETEAWDPDSAALYKSFVLGEVLACVMHLHQTGRGAPQAVVASDSKRLAADADSWLQERGPARAIGRGQGQGPMRSIRVGRDKGWSPVHSQRKISPTAVEGDYIKTWAEWFLLRGASAVVQTSGRTGIFPGSFFVKSALELRSPERRLPTGAVCTLSVCFSLAWDILAYKFLHELSLPEAVERIIVMRDGDWYTRYLPHEYEKQFRNKSSARVVSKCGLDPVQILARVANVKAEL